MASPEETTTYTVEVSDGYDVVIQQLIVQVNPLPLPRPFRLKETRFIQMLRKATSGTTQTARYRELTANHTNAPGRIFTT